MKQSSLSNDGSKSITGIQGLQTEELAEGNTCAGRGLPLLSELK